jgi:hypothetical protein
MDKYIPLESCIQDGNMWVINVREVYKELKKNAGSLLEN